MMKSGSLVRFVWALALVLPVGVAIPGTANACGTAVYREIDDTTQLVAQAEQSLSEGKFARAATKAVQAFPALKIIKPGTLPIADRALRILALASVRADGAVNAGTMRGASPADRAGNLEWSVGILRALTAKRGGNPSFQSDLGEALAKVPAYRTEAVSILGGLADKDLLTSAEGYAALARLRAASGETAAHDAALKRCAGMTKNPKICEDSPRPLAAERKS